MAQGRSHKIRLCNPWSRQREMQNWCFK